jgi:hypothetical protein
VSKVAISLREMSRGLTQGHNAAELDSIPSF